MPLNIAFNNKQAWEGKKLVGLKCPASIGSTCKSRSTSLKNINFLAALCLPQQLLSCEPMKNESVSWIIYHLHFDLHSGIWLRSDIMGSSFIVVSVPGYTLLPPHRLFLCESLMLALSTPFS